MKNIFILLTLPAMLTLNQCTQKANEVSPITDDVVSKVTNELIANNGQNLKTRIELGVKQTANLWRISDGSTLDFEIFCKNQFVADDAKRKQLFDKLSNGFENLNGYSILLNKELLRPIHLVGDELTEIDELFGAYNPAAHIDEDLFANKIAFITVLNFPYYSLPQKTELGKNWNRLDWAYARLGDMFTSRVPAELIQNYTTANTNAETYISEYNIMLGYLTDENGNRFFPEDLSLITHWGLRDELKSQYANADGLVRQKMIYEVMKHIINQTIPQQVINSKEFTWNPYTNTIAKDGKSVKVTPEPDVRYQQVLNQFNALRLIDKFSQNMPTYIQRQFDGNFELPVDDVEQLFVDLVSSPEIRSLGKLIESRLGRNLQPFDIWYDGFKARSGISTEKLEKITSDRFKNAQEFEDNLPNILASLGWDKKDAKFIGKRIKVEPARGSGHAWGAEMKKDNALLRSRIPSNGMNYKGFNIAMHEFGHCVEQTITLHNMDYYTMHGVPNTAFTEALAFVFQKRDLDVLGLKESDPNKMNLLTVDNLWACYEIMGVALVDINLWKWLYANPTANAQQVKESTIRIAKEIWNKYYADVFGSQNEPILAIYSHMINNPLYLSAYPIGHLIDFQLENQFKGRDFSAEVNRIFQQGRLIPQLWLEHGVGETLSVKPILAASQKAIEALK